MCALNLRPPAHLTPLPLPLDAAPHHELGPQVTQPVTTQGKCATAAISIQGAQACSDHPRLPACFALLPLPLDTAASLRMGPWETVHPQKQAAHLPAVLLKVSVAGWVLMGTQWGSICKPRHCVQNGYALTPQACGIQGVHISCPLGHFCAHQLEN